MTQSIYTDNRGDYRETLHQAWQKHLLKLPLEPLEQQLVSVILDHPEYQTLLEKYNGLKNQEFAIEENPFFHISLHMALREQIHCDKPNGIRAHFKRLVDQHENEHTAEHAMMTCLANMLWRGQQKGVMPDERDYLEALGQL